MAENIRKIFTNPTEPGADQATTFMRTKTEDALSECPKTHTTNESVTRGEKRFAEYPVNR